MLPRAYAAPNGRHALARRPLSDLRVVLVAVLPPGHLTEWSPKSLFLQGDSEQVTRLRNLGVSTNLFHDRVYEGLPEMSPYIKTRLGCGLPLDVLGPSDNTPCSHIDAFMMPCKLQSFYYVDVAATVQLSSRRRPGLAGCLRCGLTR